jgi:hypothetical protein
MKEMRNDALLDFRNCGNRMRRLLRHLLTQTMAHSDFSLPSARHNAGPFRSTALVSKRQYLFAFRNANDDQQLCDALDCVRSIGSGAVRKRETTPVQWTGPYATRTHLDVADRQKDEICHVRVHRKGNDEDDADRSVECGGFDDHGGRGPVRGDIFRPERFLSEGKETAGDEERVDKGQSDLEAEICKLGVDVVKDGTASLDEDNNGHGCDVYQF